MAGKIIVGGDMIGDEGMEKISSFQFWNIAHMKNVHRVAQMFNCYCAVVFLLISRQSIKILRQILYW
jgi:hypothetical protein